MEDLGSFQAQTPGPVRRRTPRAGTKPVTISKERDDVDELLAELQDFKADEPEGRPEEKKDSALPSIAVLPFVDLSPQKDQEYFCDGIAETLINELTRIEGLHVVARTSAFSFKNKDVDIREIGKKLNVKIALEGSVQKAGNRLRIMTQLVDTETGRQIWSEKYDRDMEDIFAVQDEITVAIVDKLKPKLLSAKQARPSTRLAVTPEAHDLYLRGSYFLNKYTAKDLEKARGFFEKAIERDPDFAHPHVGLADYYIKLQFVRAVRPKEVFPKATELTLKAVELDDTLSDAHHLLGYIKSFYEWDWAGGEREFERALELNPGNIHAHTEYAHMLVFMGRFKEAFEIVKRGLELDPLSPYTNLRLGEVLIHSGASEKAIEHLQKSAEMFPNHPFMRINLGGAYLTQMMFDEALREFQAQKNLPLGPILEFEADHYIGVIYALTGETDKAKKVLADLEEKSKDTYVPPCFIVRLHFFLGDHDKAYEWLDRAYEEHDFWLGYIKILPDAKMHNLGSDPRYQTLLKKIGLDK